MNGQSSRLPHLLFDLGGVLIAVDKQRMLLELARAMARPQPPVEEAVFASGLKSALDVGRIGARTFWLEVCRRTGSHIRFLDFARAYTAMFAPIVPTLQLFTDLGVLGHRRFLLTNTDPLHLGAIRRRWPPVAQVEGIAASFDLGLAKPDPRFFHQALQRLGLSGQEQHCIFVDDLAENVEAAREVGLPSLLAESPEAVRQGLCGG